MRSRGVVRSTLSMTQFGRLTAAPFRSRRRFEAFALRSASTLRVVAVYCFFFPAGADVPVGGFLPAFDDRDRFPAPDEPLPFVPDRPDPEPRDSYEREPEEDELFPLLPDELDPRDRWSPDPLALEDPDRFLSFCPMVMSPSALGSHSVVAGAGGYQHGTRHVRQPPSLLHPVVEWLALTRPWGGDVPP